jgi:fatty-acyl-CoA synthase
VTGPTASNRGPLVPTVPTRPLQLGDILRYGVSTAPSSSVVDWSASGRRSVNYAEIGVRVARLAAGLSALGVGPGDVVSTLMWNQLEHLECLLAVPSFGAVAHPLNPRFGAGELGGLLDLAGDRVLVVDSSLLDLAQAILVDHRLNVTVVVVDGRGGDLSYTELLDLGAAGSSGLEGEVDENAAATLCHTTGTTGAPKSVVYSHRAIYLHALSIAMAEFAGPVREDRILLAVPMYHVHGWGNPYLAFLVGADLILPGRRLDGHHLAHLIADEKVTRGVGIPSIWAEVLAAADKVGVSLSTLATVVSGGSRVPDELVDAYQARWGTRVRPGWGMTETGPVGATTPAAGRWPRGASGRLLPLLEARLVADGEVLPHDGQARGELEVRGHYVSPTPVESGQPCDPSRWLPTGDLASIDPDGYLYVHDRLKDMIKSRGEWIASAELERHLLADPWVAECAVVAVPDERNGERPCAVVVMAGGEAGAELPVVRLRRHLAGRVPKWWIPEAFVGVDQLPRTTVGKVDKVALRAMLRDGRLSPVRCEE